MKTPSKFQLWNMPVVFAALLSALLVGCGTSGPPRAPIAGAVSVGGLPLASGRILFVPVAPNTGPATSAMIVDGKYELDRERGPIPGRNHVEVEADLGVALDDEAAMAKLGNRLPPQPIPPQYNRQSTLVVEVAEGEQNTFDVSVPSARQTAGWPRY